MAKYASKVKESTTTTGTGPLNLDGAMTGYRAILDPAQIVSGDYVQYYLKDGSGNNAWERGFGQVTSGTPDTLSRVKVLESSNADALIDLAAGTHEVIIAPAPPLIARRIGAHIRNSSGGQSISTGSINQNINMWTGETILYDTDTIQNFQQLIMPAWADVAEVYFFLKLDAPAPGNPALMQVVIDFADNVNGDNLISIPLDGMYDSGCGVFSTTIRRNSNANHPTTDFKLKANGSGQTLTVQDATMRMDILA